LPRIVFDISTLIRWSGPPVGIVRAERELARWVKADCPGVCFAVFDPREKRYREVRADWLDAIIGGTITVLMFDLPDATGRRRRRERIPKLIRPAIMAVPQLRRRLLFRLEALRIFARTAATRTVAEQLQHLLMTDKYRRLFHDPDGTRRKLAPYSAVAGPPLDLQRADTLICAGAGWEHQDIGVVTRLKLQAAFRLVVLCYDLMPLKFPQFYRPHDVAAFRNYYDQVFALADLVVVSSHAVKRDVADYCVEHRLRIARTEVMPLGSDAAQTPSTDGLLADGLERARFVLLVSTIEPRKGHRLMYEVWLRLLAEGVPQAGGFKLVFVGRPGWMVDELMASLEQDTRLAGTLRMLPFASDEELAALYDAAAFCVYPSVYEGYGLPVVEAFARGKAVLASNGGALAETVGDFSPTLDPHDQEAWYALMKQWIREPAARAPYEAAIRAKFRPRSWRETAADFMRAVAALDAA
jgi:glycosyltransferase involved in cell wall biosynthesis